MSRLLDFENEKYQKGYKYLYPSRDNFKANIGKQICYVLKRDYDSNRGWFTVRYGIIHSVRYSILFLGDGYDDIDIRDMLDCGIKIIE